MLAVDLARQEVTLRHGDIAGFMPGMTMAFKVPERALLEGRAAGEMVRATLVVDNTEAHLRAIERTGFAALPEPAPATPVMELVARGEAVRDAALVDEGGVPRRLADWRGRVLAVTFIYTRCPLPDFCPTMDRHFRAVQDRLREDATLRGQVQLLSVSFDPEHDNPAVLAARAAAVQADPAIWRFLTGQPGAMETFASQFGVSVSRGQSSTGEIMHNLRTAVIDREGRLVTVLSGSDWTPADLLAEVTNARGGR